MIVYKSVCEFSLTVTVLLQALYFQNPKLVAGLLDVLNPNWESLVNLDVSAGPQRELVIRDRRLLSQVDDILRDLSREGSEVMERFRELTRCHPMLVLSRFPRQLMQHFGTVSLSQLYLNTTFFQNVSPLAVYLDFYPELTVMSVVLDPDRNADHAATHAPPAERAGSILPVPI